MNLVQKLNKVAEVKGVVPLSSLKQGEKYQIVKIRRTTTKYGARVVLEFEKNITFLGSRFNELTDEDLATMNIKAAAGELHIISMGKTGNCTAIEFST